MSYDDGDEENTSMAYPTVMNDSEMILGSDPVHMKLPESVLQDSPIKSI